MADNSWGHCKHCKYFKSSAERPADNEQARCGHPVLSKYALLVFGSSGCNGFELRPGVSGVEESEQPDVGA